jgi:hypothetical protein
MPIHEQYVTSGNPATDALAAERKARYAPAMTPRTCDCCGAQTTPADFWVCRWVYFYSRLGLASLLATLIGKVFLSTAKVPHATYHWICKPCVRRAKDQRLKRGFVQFIGLFLGILGLGGTMTLIAGFFVLQSPRDQAMLRSWVWLPPVVLILGIAITLLARQFRLPGVLGELDRRPFFLDSLFHSDAAKLDELQREYADVYGLPVRTGIGEES